ncbi:MAG: hypothetical protein Q7P63_01345 [Verrucomicrobiota bacterium JB022]|nr:hypothetical protein [Verrucomicrobiota bacterium JB022]
MKKIKLPDSSVTPIQQYLKIRNTKRNPTKSVLCGSHAYIAERYAHLDEAVVASKKVDLVEEDPSGWTIKDALCSCYESETKALRNLLNEIKKLRQDGSGKYCPMCGAATPKTFDHYFPRATFPEYAVHVWNLIYTCGTCNSKKGDIYKSNSVIGERAFIHFYVDDIPDVPFIRADIIETEDSPFFGVEFRLVQLPEIDEYIWRLILQHFSNLDLLGLYAEVVNDEISTSIEIVYNAVASGANARQFLEMQTKTERRRFGVSHWRAALLESMTNHPHLEKWIQAFADQKKPTGSQC